MLSKLFANTPSFVSKYLLILAEYVFLGIVIGAFVTADLPFNRWLLIGFGMTFSTLLLLIGIVVHNTTNHKKD